MKVWAFTLSMPNDVPNLRGKSYSHSLGKKFFLSHVLNRLKSFSNTFNHSYYAAACLICIYWPLIVGKRSRQINSKHTPSQPVPFILLFPCACVYSGQCSLLTDHTPTDYERCAHSRAGWMILISYTSWIAIWMRLIGNRLWDKNWSRPNRTLIGIHAIKLSHFDGIIILLLKCLETNWLVTAHS